MSMTSSDMCEIRDTIKKMIERIKIRITTVPLKGKVVNPGEHFLIKIEAQNPTCLQFKNVRWEVRVEDDCACLIPPSEAEKTQSSFGGPIVPPDGCYKKIVITYPDISPRSRIPAEGSTEIELEGVANPEIDDTVECIIKSRVFVDVDLDYLFAFGFPSAIGEQDLEIVK